MVQSGVLLSMALRRGSLTVLLIVALSFRGGISKGGDERHITRMRLLSYFPCTTARSLDECDVFAYAAAELGVEEVNWLLSSNLLPGGALENVIFELLPVSEAVSARGLLYGENSTDSVSVINY